MNFDMFNGSETWTNVWNARYNMLPSEKYQQAVVYIGESDETLKVAFVAQSNPAETLHGLYYSWALDDVEFHAAAPGSSPAAKYNLLN